MVGWLSHVLYEAAHHTPGAYHLSSKASRQKQAQKPAQKQSNARVTQPAQSAPPTPTTPAPSAASSSAAQQARLQRQAAARAEAERRKRQQLLMRGGIAGVLVLLLLGVVAYMLIQKANEPGQLVDMQASNPHVAPGAPHPAYITDPPTSGPHVDQVPQFKTYTQPITQELQVHGLEDGGAVINYKPDLDKVTVDRITALALTYQQQPDFDPTNAKIQHKNRVIVAPYNFKDPNDVIVLTAWRRILRLPAYDEEKIRRFLDAYAGWDKHAESSAGPTIP
jgi:Protein of unknown function (DUF3105)